MKKHAEGKRIFIALPLEKEFLKVFSKYRDMMGRGTPHLRWTPIADLHITLLFIGYALENATPLLSEAVEKVCVETEPFFLEFEKISYAPPNRPATMVWGVYKKELAFEHFAQKLFNEVSTIARENDGLFPDLKTQNGEPIPHTTLARFKLRVDFARLNRFKQIGVEGKKMKVDKCFVMESHLTPDGPIYRVISSHILKGDRQA